MSDLLGLLESRPEGLFAPALRRLDRSARAGAAGDPLARARGPRGRGPRRRSGRPPRRSRSTGVRNPDWTGVGAAARDTGRRLPAEARRSTLRALGPHPGLGAGAHRGRRADRSSTRETSGAAAAARPLPPRRRARTSLVTESTFGLPVFRFPPREESRRRASSPRAAQAVEEGADARRPRVRARQVPGGRARARRRRAFRRSSTARPGSSFPCTRPPGSPSRSRDPTRAARASRARS